MDKTYKLEKKDFLKLKAAWKKLVNAKAVTATDMVIYNILREKEPGHGFIAVTNPRRMKRGDVFYALNEAKFETFRFIYPPVFRAVCEEPNTAKFKARFNIEPPKFAIDAIRAISPID